MLMVTDFLSLNMYLNTQQKTKIQHELSATTSDHHRRLRRQLHRIEEKISGSVSNIQFCEGLIQYWEGMIAETRGGAEERQRKEGE